MHRSAALQIERQFSLAYLLAEIALVAIALAAGRLALFPPSIWMEAQALCFCTAMTAGSGALGGICLRMDMGLIAGAVFAVASIPLLSLVLSAA